MDEAKLDAFSDLLLQIYRTSAELPLEAYQDGVLNLLKSVVPFDSSMWGTATYVDGQGLDIHTIQLHNQSMQMIQEYESVKHLDTTAAMVEGKQQTTQAFHCGSWFADSRFGAYREFQARHEIENVMISAYTDMNTMAAQWVSLFRADEDQHCRPEDLRMLSRIAPHLMQGLRHNRMRHMNSLTGSGLNTPREAVIADARGVVHYITPGADELLRQEWGSAWQGGRLPAALMAWLSSHSDAWLGNTVVVTHQVRQDLLFVQLRARCAADDLTPRQQEIAHLMARGLSHKEAARDLNLAPATVRKQIQNVYEKLGVNNVAGMIAALKGLR